jgi:hypothetical protein
MPQTIDELRERVRVTSDIFSAILNDQYGWAHLGEKRQQLITGVNKAYGQAMAFLHEFLTTRKEENKARTVITQVHADVTSGHVDALFAKTSECKSVTQPDKGAVNRTIGDAIEQLGGTTGFHPRAEDVRIVDVQINGTNNPWPMTGGVYGTDRNPVSLAAIERNAKDEIRTILDSNKPGANAVMAWLSGQTFEDLQGIGRLREILGFNGQQIVYPNPNSSRPVYKNMQNVIHKIRCLSIKIRYDPTYPITDLPPQNCFHGLRDLVFQVYQKPHENDLCLELAKRTLLVCDEFQFIAPDRVWS